jgi:acylphosphatase
MKEIRIKVTGRVQGVFFRDFVVRQAESLSLKGCVKNTSDGSVSVIAQGGEKELKRFTTLIEEGPESAEVHNVEVKWNEPSQEFKDFKIIFNER